MAQSLANRSAGDVVAGRYRIERLLGQGGMASVYVARDRETEHELALKRLTPGSGVTAAKLFESEYRMLAGLRHPGIVEAYDYGTDADGPFYTMELVSGSELESLVPMAWRDACARLRDAAAILGVLHARKLLHRDLSARNLLLTAGGRLKLIDFGAVTNFGAQTDALVGTPPFMAPEAVAGGALDQRSDLFALGALGYFLLTGVHAFPARRIDELHALYERRLTPVSQVARLTQGDKAQAIPEELDALLSALLRIDRNERPLNTSELIDRLNAIAELPPEAQEANAQGYVESKAFVGRVRERALARQLLADADAGQARAILIEGSSGTGRSRMLEELSVSASVAGVIAIGTDARHADVAFGAASDLAQALLKALPEQAARLAVPYAQQLALASGALAESMRARPSMMVGAPGEARARTQNALRDWLLDVCREYPVALFVDDLHAVDEESQAWFASLIYADRQSRLLLVASVPTRGDGERAALRTAALRKFREAATPIELGPLASGETLELLRSIFGPVAFLERCAERLHRASRGNPAHCLELAEHLIQSGVARYVDGLWELPSELKREQLPRSRREGHLVRLAHLPEQIRTVAKLLSVPHSGSLSLAQCVAITGMAENTSLGALSALVDERVLQQLEDGYRFVSEDAREALYQELTPAEREHSHLTLGRWLDQRAGGNHIMQLRASVQLLRGGEQARPMQLLRDTITYYLRGHISTIRVGAPLCEEAYDELRNRGADQDMLSAPLALLAVAGYFVDRRYAVAYGDPALSSLAEALRLPIFYRLRSWLGQKLALAVALLIAGVAAVLSGKRTMSLKSKVSQYIAVASALNGVASTCLDPEGCRRYAGLLEPFAWLGEAPRLIHKFAAVMGRTMQDRAGETKFALEEVVAELAEDRPIPDLADSVKKNFVAGGLTAIGIYECWRDNGLGLEVAKRLDGYGPLFTLYADYLRSVHYANRGELEQAEEYRQLVEMHAVQLGSSWQVDTWAPSNAIVTVLRTQDAMLAKRVVQQLSRLSAELPRLKREEHMAQGAYLLLRGKFAQAVTYLDVDEPPLGKPGWTRMRGMLARALNGLAQHARAREVCLDAIAQNTPATLNYGNVSLFLLLELALAEAGLGQIELARQQLDALLAQHAPQRAALTLGVIHEARARVALLAHDLTGARERLLEMDGCYRRLGIAPLIERVDKLTREVQLAENPEARTNAAGPWQDGPSLLMQLSVFFTQQRHDTISQRADKALGVARDLSHAQSGFLLPPASETPLAIAGGEQPESALCGWAARALLASTSDARTVLEDEETLEQDGTVLELDGVTYRMLPLWPSSNGEPSGCIVLGFHDGPGHIPDPGVLRLIAQQVVD